MSRIRYVLAVAGKELHVLSKDRGSLVVLFLLPILLASLIGASNAAFAGGEEGEEPAVSIDILLVNEDSGPYATQVVSMLQGIDELNIRRLNSPTEADRLVADGEAIAAIIIPPGFSQGIDAYEPTRIQVVVDPVKEVGASIVSGIMNQVVGEVALRGELSYGIRTVFAESGVLENAPPEVHRAAEAQNLGAIMAQLQSRRESPLIAVRSEELGSVEEKEPLNVFGFVTPNFAVMFSFFLIGVVAETLLKEREEGSFRRLIAAPMPRGAIIAGKMLAYMLVVILQVAVLFAVGNIAFDMPLGDSAVGLILLATALAMSSSALGMLLATWAKTSSQAGSMGTIIGFILAGIGGCIVVFPDGSFMETLSLVTPHGHAVRGFYDLLNHGADVIDVLPQIGAVAGFAVIFFLIAMRRFRFD